MKNYLNLDNNTNNNNNNNNNAEYNNENGIISNDNTYAIIYFLIIYFSFQGLYQLFSNKDENNLSDRDSSEYILGFISSSVLLFFLILLRKPIREIKIDKSSIGYVMVTLIIALLYCFTENSIKNLTLKEKENMIKNNKKIGNTVISFLYVFLAFIILLYGFLYNSKQYRYKLLFSIVIIVSLYLLIILTRNSKEYDLIFNLGVFLYPFLFISINTDSKIFRTTYNILFFSTFAFFSYFGVDYFYKEKNNRKDNRKVCHNVNMDSVPNNEPQEEVNKKMQNSLKSLYICLIGSICFFIAIILFLYYYLIKKNSNV